MTRPILPTPLDSATANTWGTSVVNGIFDVSDRADAISASLALLTARFDEWLASPSNESLVALATRVESL